MITVAKQAIKILLISLTVIVSCLTLLFITTFFKRLRLPYNSEGRYFDENASLVYHQQAVFFYGLLAAVFIGLTLLIAYTTKKHFKQ